MEQGASYKEIPSQEMGPWSNCLLDANSTTMYALEKQDSPFKTYKR
jgi:hypothetical protein